jgi:hypothetical protein
VVALTNLEPGVLSVREGPTSVDSIVELSWRALIDPAAYSWAPGVGVRELMERVDARWRDDRAAWRLSRELVEYAAQRRRVDATAPAAASAIAYSNALALYKELRGRVRPAA